ncbi:DNA-binding protein [Rhizobium sp. NXC24]|uniref:DNA-binding protein n=1 Tax=Rhizobium sp. NXC24 TaxID=2048897 RepID=UPI000CF2C02E|nr:DNA-binding protein [Rhizobium sp. NXC24]
MTDVEILTGHKAIARFLGLSPRQVSWHDERGNLPTFRMGRTVCARKTKLVEWIEEKEQRSHSLRNATD